jgi:hypothetical protein
MSGPYQTREELEAAIEALLLERRDWVSTSEICLLFGIRERQLRDLDKQPGLCTRFAISRNGAGGYKHARCATTSEWTEFRRSMRKHAIKELMRVRDLTRVRLDATRTVRQVLWEKDSGQGILLQEALA